MVLSFLSSRGRYGNIEIKDYVIRYGDIKHQYPLVVNQYEECYLEKGIVEGGVIVDRKKFQEILESCLQEWGLKSKNIRFIVPDAKVAIRKIDNIPGDIPKEEMQGHLYFELGHSIHLPFENPVLDGYVLSEGEEKQEVLLVASAEEVVHAYSDAFKGGKTKPLVADVSPLCHYRLFHQYVQKEEGNYMLVQVDVLAVTVSIFENHRPVFMQYLNIPYKTSNWSISGQEVVVEGYHQEEMLFPLSDVYMELNRILRFYEFSMNNGMKSVSKMLLTGDHPYLENILQQLSNNFSFPIETLPGKYTKTNSNETVHRRFHGVLGLALKEVE